MSVKCSNLEMSPQMVFESVNRRQVISQMWLTPYDLMTCHECVSSVVILFAVDGSSQATQSQGSDVTSSQPVLSQFRGSNMSPSIRAFAFLTLGLYLCICLSLLLRYCVALWYFLQLCCFIMVLHLLTCTACG